MPVGMNEVVGFVMKLICYLCYPEMVGSTMNVFVYSVTIKEHSRKDTWRCLSHLIKKLMKLLITMSQISKTKHYSVNSGN